MIKPKIQTPWNHSPHKTMNTAPSMTIPDQTMTIKEIFDRYAAGLSLEDTAKVPMYHGEEEVPMELDRMELTDRMNLLQANADRVKDLTKKYQAEQKEAYNKALLASQTPSPNILKKPEGDSGGEQPPANS